MIKRIKKKIKETKEGKAIKKYENQISELNALNHRLQTQLSESQVSIGQWQNKLYQVQAQYDALRIAQINMLEPFKNLLMTEASLFQEANKVWVQRFDDIERKFQDREDLRAELAIYDKQYIEILKRLDKIEKADD